jgi:hypothetical protein
MAYNATYASTDLDDVFIDLVGNMGVIFVAFAGIIVIVMVWRWFKGGQLKL